jgi:hypothetical protein
MIFAGDPKLGSVERFAATEVLYVNNSSCIVFGF